MEKEYISISEFAELVGYNRTSIYKILDRSDNDLSTYCRKIGNRLKIDKSAATAVFGLDLSNSVDSFDKIQQDCLENPRTQPLHSKNTILGKKINDEANKSQVKVSESQANVKQNEVNLLYNQIEFLQNSILEKDNQIKSLNENLSNALNNLEKEQVLSAMREQKVFALEEGKKDFEDKIVSYEADKKILEMKIQELEEYKRNEESKTFFQRLFTKRKK